MRMRSLLGSRVEKTTPLVAMVTPLTFTAMAQFVRLWESRRNVLLAIVDASKEAEAHRVEEYNAAVTIQSWFRGCRLRAHLKYVNKCAIVLQKYIRGYLGRKAFFFRAKEYYEEMKWKYYNKMAARIQGTWKGYYVRKYVFDYYAHKRNMEELAKKNEVRRMQLQTQQEREERERLIEEERQHELEVEEEARKHHYMLSTQCREGVFKPPYSSLSHPFEERMKSLRFAYLRKLNRPKKKRALSDGTAQQDQMTTCGGKTLTLDTKDGITLPPLVSKVKVQGPFRQPAEVWRQRHKPLSPTLRVATSYNSVEMARAELKRDEWVNRVIDEEFLPFSRREQRYESLLHTQSSFTKPLYGTKQFRDEELHKHISPKAFRTVVPPIPVFDKLNSTY